MANAIFAGLLGLVCIIGTAIFLYIPNISMYHRMMMGCSFEIGLSFILGFGKVFSILTPIIICIVTITSVIV